MNKPTARLRRFLWLYTAAWWLLLPVVLGYLFLRGRKDSLYRALISERFGRHTNTLKGSVWVHAVSLGELRSAVPLINALLDRGEVVVTTHFTPAGRREAERVFAHEISEGRVVTVWIPFEFHFAIKRFLKAFQPKVGLVMEIEIWPRMIMSCERLGVPLYLCNAQYPLKSYTRDKNKTKWRADIHRHLRGGLVKSDLQQERFLNVGLQDIEITGELRFDQPIPARLTQAGQRWKATLNGRQVIAIPSVVVGEDDTYIAAIKACAGPDAPLFIYIPRAPERFEQSAQKLMDAGLNIARRSDVFNHELGGQTPDNIDVLLGDSMGEMYFYLAASDLAIIGGSFVEKGAHNISEPLALGKPCVVGPHVWTIEFPVVEAMESGVVTQVQDANELSKYLKNNDFPDSDAAMAFFETQLGATDRTMKALIDRGLLSP